MSANKGAAQPGLFTRLKQGLSRTATSLAGSISDIVTKKKLDAQTVTALEEALIRADVGPTLAANLAGEIDRKSTRLTPVTSRSRMPSSA